MLLNFQTDADFLSDLFVIDLSLIGAAGFQILKSLRLPLWSTTLKFYMFPMGLKDVYSLVILHNILYILSQVFWSYQTFYSLSEFLYS